jgi:hypothetical protein
MERNGDYIENEVIVYLLCSVNCKIKNIKVLGFSFDSRLGGSVSNIKENAEALVVASKDIGLDVNVDKTKCMVMSRDQNAG